ncbi:MAG: ABC transporter ATP-binding protein [Cognaticolwellia aestuarii]
MKDIVVTLTNAGKTYDKVDALKGIELVFPEGEVLGLFGHNGAGKTTMMKLILGVISATQGDVSVFGVTPTSQEAWHMRSQIGYLPENVSFYEHLTGIEVLTYFAKLKGYNKQDALVLLEQVGLSHAQKRQVKTYSKGMRQRLGLAQAFIGKPKLLLLDEPTVGLDPIATNEFYHTVDQMKTRGASIILCSHVLPGVEQHIDKAMILSQGQQLAVGSLAELRAQAQLQISIKPQGINGALASDSFLKKYWHDEQQTLLVPESEKIIALRKLLEYDVLNDVSVSPATLTQLYQHFINKVQPNHTLPITQVSENLNE